MAELILAVLIGSGILYGSREAMRGLRRHAASPAPVPSQVTGTKSTPGRPKASTKTASRPTRPNRTGRVSRRAASLVVKTVDSGPALIGRMAREAGRDLRHGPVELWGGFSERARSARERLAARRVVVEGSIDDETPDIEVGGVDDGPGDRGERRAVCVVCGKTRDLDDPVRPAWDGLPRHESCGRDLWARMHEDRPGMDALDTLVRPRRDVDDPPGFGPGPDIEPTQTPSVPDLIAVADAREILTWYAQVGRSGVDLGMAAQSALLGRQVDSETLAGMLRVVEANQLLRDLAESALRNLELRHGLLERAVADSPVGPATADFYTGG